MCVYIYNTDIHIEILNPLNLLKPIKTHLNTTIQPPLNPSLIAGSADPEEPSAGEGSGLGIVRN